MLIKTVVREEGEEREGIEREGGEERKSKGEEKEWNERREEGWDWSHLHVV